MSETLRGGRAGSGDWDDRNARPYTRRGSPKLEVSPYGDPQDIAFLQKTFDELDSDLMNSLIEKMLERSDVSDPKTHGFPVISHHVRKTPLLGKHYTIFGGYKPDRDSIDFYVYGILKHLARKQNGIAYKLFDSLMSRISDRREHYREQKSELKAFLPTILHTLFHELLHANSYIRIGPRFTRISVGSMSGSGAGFVEGVNDLAAFILMARYFRAKGVFDTYKSTLEKMLGDAKYLSLMAAIILQGKAVAKDAQIEETAAINSIIRAQFNEGQSAFFGFDSFMSRTPEMPESAKILKELQFSGHQRPQSAALLRHLYGDNPSKSELKKRALDAVMNFVLSESERY